MNRSTGSGDSSTGGSTSEVEPDYKGASADTWKLAKDGQKPIVFVFVDMNSKTAFDEDIADLSSESAVFVRVMKVSLSGVEAPAPEKKSEKPVVPQSRMDQLDLFYSYDVKTVGTVIVADWYGNEVQRFNAMPSCQVLTASVGSVAGFADRNGKKLEKLMSDAQKAADKSDTKNAVKNVLKVFKEGLTGYESFSKAVELYSKLLEEGRAKLGAANGDETVIKDLSTTYKGTDLEAEIKASKAS